MDLLKRSSIRAGITDPYEDLSGEEGVYALDTINEFIDLLGTQRLAMFRRQRVGPFTVTSGTADYSIGTGGTWDTVRPVWIDAAGMIYTASDPDVELPMRIFTLKQWARVGTKAITSTLPQALIYDPRFNSSSYGLITLYPVPSAASQVALYLPIAVTEFAALGDTIAIPPGYRAMYVWNLAQFLCAGLKDVPGDVAVMAQSSLASVKAANLVEHMDPLLCDQAIAGRGGAFNWLTGMPL